MSCVRCFTDGQVVNNWTVLRLVHPSRYLVKCSCGRERIKTAPAIRKDLGCGCQLFCKNGHKLVGGNAYHPPKHSDWTHCKICQSNRSRNWKRGLISKRILRDASKDHPLYAIWNALISRCHNPKNPSFKYYGGRGITVCKEWINSFDQFVSDMGEKPSKDHSIERKDNDGGYETDNCCWATRIEQANNRRNNHRLKDERKRNGKTKR